MAACCDADIGIDGPIVPYKDTFGLDGPHVALGLGSGPFGGSFEEDFLAEANDLHAERSAPDSGPWREAI